MSLIETDTVILNGKARAVFCVLGRAPTPGKRWWYLEGPIGKLERHTFEGARPVVIVHVERVPGILFSDFHGNLKISVRASR